MQIHCCKLILLISSLSSRYWSLCSPFALFPFSLLPSHSSLFSPLSIGPSAPTLPYLPIFLCQLLLPLCLVLSLFDCISFLFGLPLCSVSSFMRIHCFCSHSALSSHLSFQYTLVLRADTPLYLFSFGAPLFWFCPPSALSSHLFFQYILLRADIPLYRFSSGAPLIIGPSVSFLSTSLHLPASASVFRLGDSLRAER
jgi:hypothetical protein